MEKVNFIGLIVLSVGIFSECEDMNGLAVKAVLALIGGGILWAVNWFENNYKIVKKSAYVSKRRKYGNY